MSQKKVDSYKARKGPQQSRQKRKTDWTGNVCLGIAFVWLWLHGLDIPHMQK